MVNVIQLLYNIYGELNGNSWTHVNGWSALVDSILRGEDDFLLQKEYFHGVEYTREGLVSLDLSENNLAGL